MRSNNTILIHRLISSCLFILLLGTVSAKAQFFLNGEDPARIKWHQIKGKNYRIIYPREIDSLAARYLWLLENDRAKVLTGLNIDPKPIPVVLHPYTARSNGMVTWAPKRMELYTQPPSDAYAQNWETQLVLHESRHVGQVSHFTKGIYGILKYPLGEQITGVGVGVYASRWFLEGDAVITETGLSNSGRGREASFLEYYRAAFLEGDYRSWDKWRYGSFITYTPDQYAMGYLIGSVIRYRTGNYYYPGEFLDFLVRKFYTPVGDDIFYKNLTGYKTKETLSLGIQVMDSIWRSDLLQRGVFTEPVSPRHKRYRFNTDYRNTVALSADSVLYIKSSYGNPPSLVLLHNGEKRLRPFSSSARGLNLSSRKRVYFTETIGSPRWQNESYNRLFYYDLPTRKIKKLSGRTSYHSPAVNAEGDTVAVVEYKIKGGSDIVLLNASTGEKYHSFPAPHNGQLTECAWVGGELFALNITAKGMGLFRLNLRKAIAFAGKGTGAQPEGWDDQWERVINEQNITLQSLRHTGDTLYFMSGIDGITNVYMYQTGTKEFRRLTNSKYGAYDPSIRGNTLFFARIGTGGFTPAAIPVTGQSPQGYKVSLENGNLVSEYKFAIADELSRQAGLALAGKGIKDIPDDSTRIRLQREFADSLTVKKYNKLTHLFRFHSWAPVYYNVDKILNGGFDKLYEAVAPGVTFYSQNTLGTAVTMLGYSYHKGFHAGHASFKYTGLYPVLELKADINDDDRYHLKIIPKPGGGYGREIKYLSSPLLETSLRAYIPLQFNRHGWNRGLTPQIQWDFNNNRIYSLRKEKYRYRNQLNAGIQYYQMRPVATGAIFPKWGIGTILKGGFSPMGGENFGQVGSLYLYGYLPGIALRQGMKLSVSYQQQFTAGKMFYLDNLVEMPRGYDTDDIYGKKYFKASLDYAIPINFKGVSLGWIAYMKRLQIIPYADFATLDKNNLYTYGADILLDAYFFHIGTPVSIGVRYGRNGNNWNFPVDKNVFKLLFNISFY